MKAVIAISTLASALLVCGASSADTDANPYHPDITTHPRYPFALGMNVDLSVPSGAAVGIDARLPHMPWYKLGLSATYTLAPGIRGNLLIDPIRFPIAPVANIDVGHQWGFKIPSLDNSPTIDFSYTDLQGGLGFGSREGFRFMLMGGMSYLWGTANHFQGVLPTSASTEGLTIADPTFHGWVPNAKLYFIGMF